MMPIEVTIVSSERVQPASRDGLHVVPLSALDASTANFSPTDAIWLFESLDGHSSNVELGSHLRNSLQTTLNAYPQWCGTIVPVTSIDGSVDEEANHFPPHARRYGRLYARYGTAEDAGVDFTVATSTATLDSLHPRDRPACGPWNRKERPLTAFISPTSLISPLSLQSQDEEGLRRPVFVVQLTKLACGSFVIAARITHPLADIMALIHFMKDWASISRAMLEDQELPSLHPIFNPAQVDDLAAGDINSNCRDMELVRMTDSLPLHRYDWWRESPGAPFPPRVPEIYKGQDISPMGTAMPWSEWDVSKPISHYTFHLSQQEVNHIWKKASEGSTCRISQHDAILAHVWSCVLRARQVSDEKPIHCDLVYGLRPALELGESFVGCPIIMVNTELPASSFEPSPKALGPIAQKIRNTLQQMSDPTNIKAYLHTLAFEKSPQRIWQAFLGNRHILVTTWAKSGLYDVDFGLGRLRFADGFIPDNDGTVIIKEGPGPKASNGKSWTQNGVDVSVQIRVEDMERLLNDPYLFPSIKD